MVADLDALLDESISFRLHGRDHEIRPISAAEFFKFTNAYAGLSALGNKNEIPTEQLISAYYEVFSSVCGTITKEDVRQMSIAQVGALFQLIIESVTGRAQVDQKKTLEKMMATAQVVSQSSVQ
jgi:hypothetical protein